VSCRTFHRRVALPDTTRHGAPAFEHHGELPAIELGAGWAIFLVGAVADTTSPARRDSDHVGLDLALAGGPVTMPVRPDFEYALVVFAGAVDVHGGVVTSGHLAYLGSGRDELAVAASGPPRRCGSVVTPSTSRWSCGGATSPELATRSSMPTTSGPVVTPASGPLPRRSTRSTSRRRRGVGRKG
jgi:hypothetical protein